MSGSNFFTASTSTLDIAMTDASGYAMYAKCTGTPPTTASVFQHGCILVVTDSASTAVAIYENTGTTASPVWTPLAIQSASQVFIADGNGTTPVRLGGSPTSNLTAVITAVEVISLDDANGTITFSNGCSTQNITITKGCTGTVRGCSGSSIPVTSGSGCFTATNNASSRYVAKVYFSTPTNP